MAYMECVGVWKTMSKSFDFNFNEKVHSCRNNRTVRNHVNYRDFSLRL